MKTKEFIKKVESMGYKIDKRSHITFVIGSDGYTKLSVYNDFQYNMDSNYGTQVTPELFNLVVEYAKTPVSKRS